MKVWVRGRKARVHRVNFGHKNGTDTENGDNKHIHVKMAIISKEDATTWFVGVAQEKIQFFLVVSHQTNTSRKPQNFCNDFGFM